MYHHAELGKKDIEQLWKWQRHFLYLTLLKMGKIAFKSILVIAICIYIQSQVIQSNTIKKLIAWCVWISNVFAIKFDMLLFIGIESESRVSLNQWIYFLFEYHAINNPNIIMRLNLLLVASLAEILYSVMLVFRRL